eukprot:CAMPEP_0204608552 /NCGR_PEP_ID=MMETSP0661-20131031/60384_1 /ASSEMBLY_ACC=CAM_ASM_000606 /TAXON_ID=109239 /ORGANISM="Alexandrium margalefi, Strain AMGDE01CS-322" /LENGTH=136 /DNA_ID=CAMNT_0051620085 /DNA_START=1 /DNA_END=411 /DNA_ORIENTATION=-
MTGFYWEMDSGRCFRIERRIFVRNGLMMMRQITEMNGALSFIFHVKVSMDPGYHPIPVQSRDHTALAGLDNAPDSLGKPYPCTAQDLDRLEPYPCTAQDLDSLERRDTCFDREVDMIVQDREAGIDEASGDEDSFA